MDKQKQNIEKSERSSALEDVEKVIEKYALGAYKMEEIRKILEQANESYLNKIFSNGRNFVLILENILQGKEVVDDKLVKKIRRALHLRFSGGITAILVAIALSTFDKEMVVSKYEKLSERFDTPVSENQFLMIMAFLVVINMFRATVPDINRLMIRGKIYNLIDLDMEDIGKEKLDEFKKNRPEIFINFVKNILPGLIEQNVKERQAEKDLWEARKRIIEQGKFPESEIHIRYTLEQIPGEIERLEAEISEIKEYFEAQMRIVEEMRDGMAEVLPFSLDGGEQMDELVLRAAASEELEQELQAATT